MAKKFTKLKYPTTSAWREFWGYCPSTKKRNFPKLADVKLAARKANLRYYRCTHCDNYHLTSQPTALNKAYKLLLGQNQ
jgi:hypothetical protein